ncbi:hypothetical protein HON52_03200 [Candidatus Uhrbacteria bacterium]|nr:hypothetical protein [Candidatus Uhrbacteria bacterium]
MHYLRTGFKRCTRWLQKNRLSTVGTLAAMFVFAAAHPAHAQDFGEMLLSQIGTMLDILLLFAALILNVIGYAIGKLIVLILGMVVIPIMGYNGFADSNIVDIGWPLVRDVVNMFVIIILLVIAIKTIIGSKSANWQQQLPRLFIAIVAVNFSRTITLLIVDVGQVVMFTFVNALRDIAAGNFVNMFQLTSFFANNIDNIDAINNFSAGGAPMEGLGYLATSYATLVFMIAVLGVLVLLAIVFIYRIVLIWVLLIMSPMAFFLSGIKEIVPRAGGPAGEWWTKLIGAVTLGPILTFFLWLALAAAAEGSLASSEGFPIEGTEDVPSLLAEVFRIEELLSLFLAMVLIMAGFQAASSAASGMGGFAGKMINENTGKSLVKNAVKAPASLAYKTGRLGVRGGMAGARLGARAGMAGGRLALKGGKMAAIEGARQLESREGTFSNLGKAVQGFGGEMEARGGLSGRIAGNLARGAGGWVEGKGNAMQAEARAAASESLDGMTARHRVGSVMDLEMGEDGRPKMPKAASDRNKVEGAYARLATDGKERKELKGLAEERAKSEAGKNNNFADEKEKAAWMKERQNEIYDEQMSRVLEWSGSDSGKAMLGDKKSDLNKMKAGNLRGVAAGAAAGNETQAITEFLNEMGDDFKISMLSEEDMESEHVLEALSAKTMREFRDKDNNIVRESALDQAALGKGGVGTKVKNAASGEGAKFDELYRGTGGGAGIENPSRIAQALKNEKLKISDLTVDHLSTNNTAGVSELDDKKIQSMAKAMMKAGTDLGGLEGMQATNPAAYNKIMDELEKGGQNADLSAEERRQYQKAYLSADVTGGAANNFVNGSGGFQGEDQKKSVREMIVQQPTQTFNFQANIDSTQGSTDLTKLIASKTTSATARNMSDLYDRAGDDKDPGLQDRIRKSAKATLDALEREHAAAEVAGGATKQLTTKLNQFRALHRNTPPPTATP